MSNTKKPKSLGQTIVSIVLDVLVLLSLISVILAGYTALKYKDDPGNAYLFGYKPILVLTGSMEPTMHVNSICIAEKTTYEDVKSGDIIMFEVDDKLITHRVVSISDEGITTKGDNNNVEDAYALTSENIKAKVVSIWNWTAPIINYGWQKVLAFALVAVFIIIMLIHFIIKIVKMPEDDSNADSDSKDEDKSTPELENTTEEIPQVEDTEAEPSAEKPTEKITEEPKTEPVEDVEAVELIDTESVENSETDEKEAEPDTVEEKVAEEDDNKSE